MRPRETVLPFAAGVGMNAALATAVMRGRPDGDEHLRSALRVTGNAAFVLIGTPLATWPSLPERAPQVLWRAFLGAHALHATLIARLALRHNPRTAPFSATSRIAGPIGYTTIAVLTATSAVPGPAPQERWRRAVQRGGHNILLAMHAATIWHGYFTKGRERAYLPLAALWLSAAYGLDRTWRGSR